MTDVIQQPAEMPCPGCPCCLPNPRLPSSGPIPGCSGTGLRWPALSRRIGMDDPEHSARHLIGSRVPDVTLEKVLDIHIAEGRTQPQDWFLFDRLLLRTPTEAACAALLATKG